MKRVYVLCSTVCLVGAIAALALVGCPSTTPKPAAPGTKGTVKDDPLHTACERLREAKTLTDYQEALAGLNHHMHKPETVARAQLSNEEHRFLKDTVGLGESEIKEVESLTFQALDGHHLEMSFLFRDVARSLELKGLSPLDQARHGFWWVMRHIVLEEGPSNFLPPHLVLKRRHGDGLDRSLAFLALVRHFGLEGCILGLPAEKSGDPHALLTGVLIEGEPKDQIYLFDARLGVPVAGPKGKGIASLSQVREQPALLDASGLKPDQVKQLQVWAVCPLSGLSPRMRYLERPLESYDRVVLGMDAAKLVQKLATATGGDVQVWNAPATAKGPPPNSPTRSLRHFFPASEGGIDDTGRWTRFKADLVPWHVLFQKLQQLRLMQELPDPARQALLKISEDTFTKFALQPRDMLVRGHREQTLQRLGRILAVLDIQENIQPGDPRFDKELDAWRKRIHEAFLALVRDKDGEAQMATLWGEDLFWFALLQVDSEINPLVHREKYPQKTLTRVMVAVCREVLEQQAAYLQSMCLHEEAEHYQAHQDMIAARGEDSAVVSKRAQNAWLNVRGEWNKYLERYSPGPALVRARLDQLAAHRKAREWEKGLFHWEQLLQEYTTACQARLLLMRAFERQGQTQQARSLLQNLAADLDAFTNHAELKKELAQYRDDVRNLPQASFRQRLESIARHFEAGGALSWFRARALAQSTKY